MKLLKTSQYVIMTKCQVIVKTDCIYFHAEPFHLRLSFLLVSIMPFLTYIYYPLYSSNLNTHSGTNSESAITHYIHSPLLMRKLKMKQVIAVPNKWLKKKKNLTFVGIVWSTKVFHRKIPSISVQKYSYKLTQAKPSPLSAHSMLLE